MKNSYKNLVASIQLCVSLDKDIGRIRYSKFNAMLLSFLCQRGFVRFFKFLKKGSNGYIEFQLRRVNGALLCNKVLLPRSSAKTSFKSQFTKYKAYRSLINTYTSEFVVISTNRGLMTVSEATSMRIGGLIICVMS